MPFSVGIFGLPNVGKSTLFQAITKKQVDISNYPFCTIEPNIGVVKIPDPRLNKLAEIENISNVFPPVIEFRDVAGLVRHAHKGEGLGNQFLAHLRECDVLLHVVRCFRDNNIPHVEGGVDPERDIKIIQHELCQKDLQTIENRLQKIEKEAKQGKKEARKEWEELINLKDKLSRDIPAGVFSPPHLFLLTAKPQLIVLNSQENEIPPSLQRYLSQNNLSWIQLDIKEELEKSEFGEKERKELGLSEPKIDRLIEECFKITNAICFYTIAGNTEARGYSLKKGENILQAAGKIHSDFKEKFKRAEVAQWSVVVENKGWKNCREKGLLKIVGKNYIVEDGDVIEIKI